MASVANGTCKTATPPRGDGVRPLSASALAIAAQPFLASCAAYTIANMKPLRPQLLEWNDVRLLLAVANQGTYAAAARHAGVSLATVGRRIRLLERSLGTKLVERRPDGHRLTAQAQALLPAASRMAAAAGDLYASIGAGSANVRIVAREWEALFLIRHLAELKSSLPGIDIEIGSNHWPDLARREADLVLTEHSPASGSVIARKLGAMSFAAYAGSTYASGERRAFSEERYAACAWVGFTPAHSYFAAEQWLARHRPDGVPPTHRFDNAFMVLEAVRHGSGLGLLPVWLGESDASLVRVSPVLRDLVHTTNYLMNADLRDEPRVRAVADAVHALFRRERSRLAGEAVRP